MKERQNKRGEREKDINIDREREKWHYVEREKEG